MQALDPADPTSLQDQKYQLLGILGEGSMGRTYLAEVGSRKVAIKALYPSRLATAKDLELFVREANVLQKLDHPRIPAYLDAFDEGEGEAVRYHLVQEFVDGETLRSVIERGDRYDEARAITLLRSLLELLQYLHSCDPKVVHRDIKPDNIILRASDNAAVLVDFGAVREVVRLTMGGGSTIIGTYGYMPPEQLMGRAQPASDIYSVAITILELLTRQTPTDLHGQDALRLIDAANVSDHLRRVLRRMCAPALADRYNEASQVLADLDATEAGRALVHAQTIERAIDKREKQEQRELERASTPGVARVGVFVAVASIGSAASVVVMVLSQLARGVEIGLLGMLGLSFGALLITAIMMMTRYTHDAWEPPDRTWVKATATIERYEVDVVNRDGSHSVLFSFPTGHGRKAEHAYSDRGKRAKIGHTFDIYYQPSNPAYWEAQDFKSDPTNAMSRLFDRNVKHTPE